nr:unnamed protein product [Digitaria exilis]
MGNRRRCATSTPPSCRSSGLPRPWRRSTPCIRLFGHEFSNDHHKQQQQAQPQQAKLEAAAESPDAANGSTRREEVLVPCCCNLPTSQALGVQADAAC